MHQQEHSHSTAGARPTQGMLRIPGALALPPIQPKHQPFPLLRLPPELRNLVYAEHFANAEESGLMTAAGAALLVSCRQIRSEAIALYYAPRRLLLKSLDIALRFVRGLTESSRGLPTGLAIAIDDEETFDTLVPLSHALRRLPLLESLEIHMFHPSEWCANASETAAAALNWSSNQVSHRHKRWQYFVWRQKLIKKSRESFRQLRGLESFEIITTLSVLGWERSTMSSANTAFVGRYGLMRWRRALRRSTGGQGRCGMADCGVVDLVPVTGILLFAADSHGSYAAQKVAGVAAEAGRSGKRQMLL